MDALTGWLSGASLEMIYLFLFLAAFVEGVIPLMPGDVAAALLAFFAARAGGHLAPTIVVVTSGSVLGALAMWWIGRRFGAEWVAHRIGRMGFGKAEQRLEAAEQKVESAYQQYGWTALFVSRFVPGVRAVVPAAAGALRIPLWEVTAIFTIASGIWYGVISWIAFRVGEDWSTVRHTFELVARDVGIGAIGVAIVMVLIGWRLWKRHVARTNAPPAA